MKFLMALAFLCILCAISRYPVVSKDKSQESTTEAFPDEMPKVSGRVAERKSNGLWIVADDDIRLFISTGALLEHEDTDFAANEYVSFICYNNKIPGELKKEECARMVNLYNWMFDGDPTPYSHLLLDDRPVYFAALASRPERNHQRHKEAIQELRKLLPPKDEKAK
jgi:hypothetical protein